MQGEQKKQKVFSVRNCVVFINHNATFLKVCNLSERCIDSKNKKNKKNIYLYIKAHGPKAQGPSFDLYIYIYIYNIYWVGPPRGAHGEETHPPLVGLQFSSLIQESFLQYKLIKKPFPIRCGTRGFVFKKDSNNTPHFLNNKRNVNYN